MTGEDYSLILHCTVGHMRRVDEAQPDFANGKKAVNFFRSATDAHVHI
jgi:hypothetical protein